MSEGEIEIQRLPCKLSPSERDAKDAELVRLTLHEARQKEDKKAKVSEMNAQLKQTRSSIEQTAKELDEGVELRDVEVELVYDYGVKKVFSKRRDTDETLHERDMESADLQETLPDEDFLPPPEKPKPRRRSKKHGQLTDVPDQSA